MSMTESVAFKVFKRNYEEAMKNIEILNNITLQLTEYLDKYRDIGTVGELRELKEKATAKKPNDITELKGDFGTVGKCPCCNGIIDDTYCYCDDCGQKLDWSEGKE